MSNKYFSVYIRTSFRIETNGYRLIKKLLPYPTCKSVARCLKPATRRVYMKHWGSAERFYIQGCKEHAMWQCRREYNWAGPSIAGPIEDLIKYHESCTRCKKPANN